MLATKIRPAIVALTATFAVAVTPAASQAARPPGLPVPHHVLQTDAVAKDVGAGSAGIPGYDDAKCQSLADDLNKALDIVMEENDSRTPNSSRAKQAFEIGQHANAELTDNCLVIY